LAYSTTEGKNPSTIRMRAKHRHLQLLTKNFARGHGPLQIIDKLVVPSDTGEVSPTAGDSTGPSILPESVASFEQVGAVAILEEGSASFEGF
jgi:hypothetical protein